MRNTAYRSVALLTRYVLAACLLTGCTTHGDGSPSSNGTAPGAGAAAEGGIGYSMDRQEAELRAQLTNEHQVEIERVRDDLLRLTLANEVSFDPNSAAVKPTFEPTLAKVAAVLARYPNSRITVVGHTDSTGFDDFNTLLSRDRALAVLEALALGGVAADSLSAFGRGESKPRSSNRTADGRARNSRVEILLEPGSA